MLCVVSALLCRAVVCAVLCRSQVLSKELLSAVQVVESEILSSQDALPAATLKFFLKAGRTMGQGWVSVSGSDHRMVCAFKHVCCMGGGGGNQRPSSSS